MTPGDYSGRDQNRPHITVIRDRPIFLFRQLLKKINILTF
jgi:hypothetical protein